MTQKYIQINGLNISYTDTNKGGKVILFLNGWKGSRKSWDKNIIGLRQNFRCIAIDFPGFGISDTPTKIWDTFDYALFVYSFIRTIGIKKLTLVGKSFGGRVAIIYANKYPSELENLILVASAGTEHKNLKTKFKIMVSKIGKFILIKANINRTDFLKAKYYTVMKIQKDENAYRNGVRKIVTNQDLTKTAKMIKVRTQIIWGDKDSVLPLKIGKQLNESINNSNLIVIKDAGHSAHEVQYKKFNQLLAKVCAD